MHASLKLLQLQSTQYLYSVDPATLLPIELAAALLGKSPSTLRTDITRRPQSLPVFARFGRRVFFIKRDIDSFIAASRCVQQQAPTAPAPKRGRPTKAEQAARAKQQRDLHTLVLVGKSDAEVNHA
jgi:hypothetical protein